MLDYFPGWYLQLNKKSVFAILLLAMPGYYGIALATLAVMLMITGGK